ncbi:MAG: glycosyltransferase family 2 protein [Paracoccaceae bacterium]|jgi:glycosyltransferase involved in cell wall biosynthesis
MIETKTLCVIVPAYNEEKLLPVTIMTMPTFVDRIVIVNDCSTDNTKNIADEFSANEGRVEVIHHNVNKGLGQSLIDGYLYALTHNFDIVAVMAGDNQMSPDDLPRVVSPIARGQADYVKGNRLLRDDVVFRMPRHRYIGNAVLTLLTKFATGYWRIIDPQCGYTAISHKALSQIPIEQMIKGYGYNAHILNMLNLNNFKVTDVEVEPVYGEEKSKIKLKNYIPTVSKLLLRLFAKRMVHKYLIRDFHPLVLLYLFSIFNTIFVALPLAVRFIYIYISLGIAPQTTLIIFSFSSMMATFGLLFAMWMDMEDNRRLSVDADTETLS